MVWILAKLCVIHVSYNKMFCRMKTCCFLLVLVSIFFEPSFSYARYRDQSVNNPGFKARITQKGLNYCKYCKYVSFVFFGVLLSDDLKIIHQ